MDRRHFHIWGYCPKCHQFELSGKPNRRKKMGMEEEPNYQLSDLGKLRDVKVKRLTAFAINISTEQIDNFRCGAYQYPEADYADIRVTINGLTKKFTMKDFAYYLGFINDYRD